MKEKIEKINFNELSLDDAQELLNELLTHKDEDFKDLVTTIIDTIEYSVITSEEVPVSIDLIFNNDRVKLVVDDLLDEYKESE